MRTRQAALTALWIVCVALTLGAVCPPLRSTVRFSVNSVSREEDASLRAETNRLMQEAGFKWVRVFFPWSELQPDQNSPLNYSKIDAIVGDAQAGTDYLGRGFSIVGVLVASPQWAQLPPGSYTPRPACAGEPVKDWAVPPYPDKFGTFARDVALHLAGKVATWELWNEPNNCSKWAGSPDDYVNDILVPGYDYLTGAAEIPGQWVIAPTFGSLPDNLDNFLKWFTYSSGPFAGSLVRPINSFSFHAYGSQAHTLSELDRADTISPVCCNASDPQCPAPYCVQSYWLTEFGFGSDPPVDNPGDVCGYSKDATPGPAANAVFDRCNSANSANHCRNAFYFVDSDWRYRCLTTNCYAAHKNEDTTCDPPCRTSLPCNVALLRLDNTPRKKYCKIGDRLTSVLGMPAPTSCTPVTEPLLTDD